MAKVRIKLTITMALNDTLLLLASPLPFGVSYFRVFFGTDGALRSFIGLKWSVYGSFITVKNEKTLDLTGLIKQ